MINIAQIADRIGEHICKGAELESELKKVCFGIEVMLVMVISFITTILLGGFLGMLNETLIIILTAMLVKFIIGGSHLSSFFRCLIYSITITLFGALICKNYSIWLNNYIAVILFTIDLIILLKAPLFPSYRVLERKQIITRKFLVSILLCISLWFYFYQANLFSSGALIGFSLSIINISPAGANFMKWLDKVPKK
jgi:accessory gene regulator B